MSEKIVQLNKEVIKGQIKELVRSSVEENLNELLGKEAETLTQAIPATSAARPVIRATAAATMTATSPRLPATSRSTCLVSRACPSRLPSSRCTWQAFPCAVWRDITEALWGSKISPATISELNKKAYVHIEDWWKPPLAGRTLSIRLRGQHLPAPQLGRGVRKCSHSGGNRRK